MVLPSALHFLVTNARGNATRFVGWNDWAIDAMELPCGDVGDKDWAMVGCDNSNENDMPPKQYWLVERQLFQWPFLRIWECAKTRDGEDKTIAILVEWEN